MDFTPLCLILPCCIILTFINTALFLPLITVTLILKWICSHRMSCLMANHHNMCNNVIMQRSLVRSAFFPTALISEEFPLAAQRVRRMQQEGTLSLSCSSTLQLVSLKNHTKADDILVLVSFRSVW